MAPMLLLIMRPLYILFTDQLILSHNMSDEGSDAEVYEVEKLLDKRVKKGKTEYLVKWKGKASVHGIGVLSLNKSIFQVMRMSLRTPGSQWRISTVRTRSRITRRKTRCVCDKRPFLLDSLSHFHIHSFMFSCSPHPGERDSIKGRSLCHILITLQVHNKHIVNNQKLPSPS